MALAADHQPTTATEALLSFAKRIFRRNKPRPANKAPTVSRAMPTSRDDLLQKIENGYVVEGTGERVQIPSIARTHLKTSVELGGWV